jgi:hypothetical protein
MDWCKIANALTDADYSSKVGQCLQIQSTWTNNGCSDRSLPKKLTTWLFLNSRE